MTFQTFRLQHLFNLLQDYELQSLPLDLFINRYFRAHKSLGSKDRGFIAEKVYSFIRWRGIVDYLCPSESNWQQKLEVFDILDFDLISNREDIPIHVRLSFPEHIFELFVASHGFEKACELCRISNTSAPTTVRTNTLKITRAELLSKWKSLFQVSPCRFSEQGIIFHQKLNFFSLPEFKAGLFEVQDEGSQLLADLVQPESGQQIMDYCAGSGGKTLAFAHRLKSTGQIHLHDVREFALQEAKKRLRRAGIQNAQVVQADDAKLKKLKKKMDWVLVDAPCSGMGTLRRNPDMKWKFTKETLQRLVSQQKVIFEKALSYMKPNGRIIYATCSLLKEENQEQVSHFLKTYDIELEGELFQTLPSLGGMDGFFAAKFKKK